ncbi:cyclin-dependent kinase 9 [Hyalella azteca]|uniref:Cyclin-dependent kinase 9 n=1 Tax=Hyalella azteca TaxID=294128 RepID=A0A8B7P1J4_HYAAZ|nr:cyclin-dependent kinase 9 [Hyalella azteca]
MNTNRFNTSRTPKNVPAPVPTQFPPNSSYYEDLVFPYCEDISGYERLTKIGQGTFGEVFKARARDSGRIVALKKILMDNEKEGFPITALREIRILKLLNHENVVSLLGISRQKGFQHKTAGKGSSNKNNPGPPFGINVSMFFLVFEFCEHDLAGLLSNVAVKFNMAEIKKIMQQLLNGLYYIHSNNILHRDLKASNVLITKKGVLKLADFGLARAFSKPRNQKNRYTNRVVTLWYRPPELLLGERNYGPHVDMWGAGCIMAELWVRSPILQGESEQRQLYLISKLCGSITPEVWPSVVELEMYGKIELLANAPRKTKDRLLPYIKDNSAMELIDKLLVLDPSKRIDATLALDHDFFWNDPLPADLSTTLSHHTMSMFEYLAPTRHRRGAIKPAGPQQQVMPPRNQDNISSYQERVY